MTRWNLEHFKREFRAAFPNIEEMDHHTLEIFFESAKDDLPAFFERHLAIGHPVYLSEEERVTKLVPLDQLHGQGWMFAKDFGGPTRSGYTYPKAGKLAHWFLFQSPDEMEPIEAIQVSDSMYYIEDGNHRLYTAYLKGWNHVPTRVLGHFQPSLT